MIAFVLTLLCILSVFGFFIRKMFKRIWIETLLHTQGICGKCKTPMTWEEPIYICPTCGRKVEIKNQ